MIINICDILIQYILQASAAAMKHEKELRNKSRSNEVWKRMMQLHKENHPDPPCASNPWGQEAPILDGWQAPGSLAVWQLGTDINSQPLLGNMNHEYYHWDTQLLTSINYIGI